MSIYLHHVLTIEYITHSWILGAFAPPPNLYQRSNSPSPPPASRRSPSPPPPERIQPKANIDLNESADDAYMRRLRMSSQRAAVAQHQEEDTR